MKDKVLHAKWSRCAGRVSTKSEYINMKYPMLSCYRSLAAAQVIKIVCWSFIEWLTTISIKEKPDMFGPQNDVWLKTSIQFPTKSYAFKFQ